MEKKWCDRPIGDILPVLQNEAAGIFGNAARMLCNVPNPFINIANNRAQEGLMLITLSHTCEEMIKKLEYRSKERGEKFFEWRIKPALEFVDLLCEEGRGQYQLASEASLLDPPPIFEINNCITNGKRYLNASLALKNYIKARDKKKRAVAAKAVIEEAS